MSNQYPHNLLAEMLRQAYRLRHFVHWLFINGSLQMRLAVKRKWENYDTFSSVALHSQFYPSSSINPEHLY